MHDGFSSEILGDLPAVSHGAVGGVRLPTGVLVKAEESQQEDDTPRLWASADSCRELSSMLTALADKFRSTGLWPLALESLSGADERPWIAGELDPSCSTQPESFDAQTVLQNWWQAHTGGDDVDTLAPFGKQFPGLALATVTPRKPPELGTVVRDLTGRLGLVPTRRPADVVTSLGWLGPVNHFSDMAQLSAVLRSWEERFDAYVVGIGFDTLTLAVGRPPLTLKAAQVVAAEHFATCSDNIYQGVGSISAYAEDLVGAARWDFWWD